MEATAVSVSVWLLCAYEVVLGVDGAVGGGESVDEQTLYTPPVADRWERRRE